MSETLRKTSIKKLLLSFSNSLYIKFIQTTWKPLYRTVSNMLPLGKIFSWWIYYRFKFFLFFCFLYKHLGTPHTCIEELLYTLVVRQNYLAIGFHVFFFNYSRQTSNKNFLNFNNKFFLNQYSIGHLFYHNSLEQFRQNILWYLKKEKGIFNSKLQVILHKI